MSNDELIKIAKNSPTSFTKAKWFDKIVEQAEMLRSVGEPQAIAFTRYIEKHDEGQILYQAYRLAPRPDWQPPQRVEKVAEYQPTAAYVELEKMAKQVRINNPSLTKEQAFSRVLETPLGQKFYRHDKDERLKISTV